MTWTPPSHWSGTAAQHGFSVSTLFGLIDALTASVNSKLLQLKARNSAVSIGDMFEMQMLMNHLSQISEAATGVVSASNTAIMSMARAVKG